MIGPIHVGQILTEFIASMSLVAFVAAGSECRGAEQGDPPVTQEVIERAPTRQDAAPRRDQGDPLLTPEMIEAANQIGSLLKQKMGSSVSFSQFNGPATLGASAGSGIIKVLRERLKSLGIAVEPLGADFGISGNYRTSDEPNSKKKIVQIHFNVEDGNGRVVNQFEKTITSEAAIAILLGLTVVLPPGRTGDMNRNEALAESIAKPETRVEQTKIFAGESRKLAVEVLLKTPGGTNAARVAQMIKNQAFVPLQRDDVFAIRLINDNDYAVAAVLSIDGLNVFSFSENKNYTHFIIKPNEQLTVPGWHRTNQKSDEFLITELAKGAAAELKSKAPVGTITVLFQEVQLSFGEGDAAGRGNSIDSDYVEIPARPKQLLGSVSVRYLKSKE